MMELTEAKEEVAEWLALCDPNGEFSSVLVEQLASGMASGTLHVHSVYDAIKKVSKNSPYNIGQTKPESEFKRPPLNKLWHKHFFQASFMPQNMLLEMKKGDNYKQAFNRAMKASGIEYGEVMNDKFFAHLASEMTVGMYDRRAKGNKLTGEWVVYLPLNNKNYYLTLGVHGKDEQVLENVQRCFVEFPEVQDYLKE